MIQPDKRVRGRFSFTDVGSLKVPPQIAQAEEWRGSDLCNAQCPKGISISALAVALKNWVPLCLAVVGRRRSADAVEKAWRQAPPLTISGMRYSGQQVAPISCPFD